MVWNETCAGLPERTLILVGPTASGKSEAALEIAERAGCEIVSADSVQVYRGMDIGAAKPAPEERRRVRHWMIDLVPVRERYDVARYCAEARAAVADIVKRGGRPLVVGGSGMYLRALVQGLDAMPPRDPAVRSRLEALAARDGRQALHDELRRMDPESADRIHPANVRRVVRALEVCRISGLPISAQQRRWAKAAPGPVFGIDRSRDDLVERIHRRVDAMIEAGWVAEVRRLLAEGLRDNPSALAAVGYRQWVEHLDGRMTFDEARESVRAATRALARRQLTWLRHQLSVTWIPACPDTPGRKLAGSVLCRAETE